MVLGDKFGRLTAIMFVGRDPQHRAKWLFECECGNTSVAVANNIQRGKTKSCGCWRRENSGSMLRTHGGSKDGKKTHYLYKLWTATSQRCHNPNDFNYSRYGGRGIQVCPEWRESFEMFRDYVLTNLGERPKGYTFDRIDNDSNYQPGNVRWASKKTQANNRRNGNMVKGERHPQAKLNEECVKVIRFLGAKGVSGARLARAYGVSQSQIYSIRKGKTWKHVTIDKLVREHLISQFERCA